MSKRGVLFDARAVREAVRGAPTQTEALRRLGLKPHADNYRRLREACGRAGVECPPSNGARSSPFERGRVSRDVARVAVAEAGIAGEALDAVGLVRNTRNFDYLDQFCKNEGLALLPRKGRGVLRSAPDSLILWSVRSSRSHNEALRKLGLASAQKNYRSLDREIERIGIPEADRFAGDPEVAQPDAQGVLAVPPSISADPRKAARVLERIKGGSKVPQALRDEGIISTLATRRWVTLMATRSGIEIRGEARAYTVADLRDGITLSRSALHRLAKESDLIDSDQCALCGMPPEWQGEPLVFHLDHRDGDTRNNAPGNLRFLCPNCHSQTETYCRR